MKNTDLDQNEQQVLGGLGLQKHGLNLRISRLRANAGDILFTPGDESKAFLILLQGTIRVDLTTKTDREVMLYRVTEAQTCLITTTALLKSDVYFAKGVAETDIRALAIPAVDFHRAIIESPVFSKYVLSDYARRVESLVGLIDRLTSKDIKADISAALLCEMDAQGTVYMTQAAFARNIGTAREVVARRLAELEEQGIVKRERGKIKIIDKNGLV